MPLWADHTVAKGLEGWSWVVKLDKKQPCMHGHFCAKYSSSKFGLKGKIVFPEEEDWNIVSIISRMHLVVLSFECFTCMLFIFQTTVYFVFIRKSWHISSLNSFFSVFFLKQEVQKCYFFSNSYHFPREKKILQRSISAPFCAAWHSLIQRPLKLTKLLLLGLVIWGSSISLTERDWNSTVITWSGHWPLAKEE